MSLFVVISAGFTAPVGSAPPAAMLMAFLRHADYVVKLTRFSSTTNEWLQKFFILLDLI